MIGECLNYTALLMVVVTSLKISFSSLFFVGDEFAGSFGVILLDLGGSDGSLVAINVTFEIILHVS